MRTRLAVLFLAITTIAATVTRADGPSGNFVVREVYAVPEYLSVNLVVEHRSGQSGPDSVVLHFTETETRTIEEGGQLSRQIRHVEKLDYALSAEQVADIARR